MAKTRGRVSQLALATHQSSAADQARMKAAIDGEAGLLGPAEVVEVWTTGEVVIRFLKASDGAERVLLKGADTTLVADGFKFYSDRTWRVIHKRTYHTAAGVDRSILVAEPLEGSKGTDTCAIPGRAVGRCYSKDRRADGLQRGRIVQILNDHEMLLTMHVSTGLPGSHRESDDIVLLRGVGTRNLTEDSPPPFNEVTGGPKPEKLGKYPITGTYRYKTTGGTIRTVFVADAEKAEADRMAHEKNLEEERAREEKAQTEARKRERQRNNEE